MNNYSDSAIHAAVIGYTGYSGAELVDLLLKHPGVRLTLLDHSAAKDSDSAHHPVPCGMAAPPRPPHVPWSPAVIAEEKLDLVFTATPPEVSLEIIPQILAQGARAIDLSGAFRLPKPGQYQRWYKAEHTQPAA